MKSMKLFALVISTAFATTSPAEVCGQTGSKAVGSGGGKGRTDREKRRPGTILAKQQQHFDSGLNSKDQMI